MKSNIYINREDNTIEITKAFYNRACQFGTPEFEELNRAIKQFPEFTIAFKSAKKKTYNGLTIKKMAAYIETLEDKDLEAKFEAVQKVAESRKALYPLTKQWFLNTFKNITMKDIEEAIKAKDQQDMEAEVAAEMDIILAEMANQDLEEEEPVETKDTSILAKTISESMVEAFKANNAA